MNAAESITIVKALARGVNPRTGKEFSEKSAYRNPRTIQALRLAINGLELLNKCEGWYKKLPNNAGKYWDDNEDNQLISAFDAGKTISQLSQKHQRTEGAISSRLVMHGKLEPKHFSI